MCADLVLEGGCLCGNIRYRSLKAPVFASHCHCQLCRRHSGALFATHLGLPVNGFTWLQGKPTYWRSSPAFERGFCATCGSTVAARYLDDPSIHVIPAGTLDDVEKVTADRHIMTESQVSWLKLEDNLPRHARLSPPYAHLDLGL